MPSSHPLPALCHWFSRLASALDPRCATGQGHAWDDRVKSALYQLPTSGTWLVGAYLFDNHDEFMAALVKMVGPRLDHPLLHAPQFQSPTGSG